MPPASGMASCSANVASSRRSAICSGSRRSAACPRRVSPAPIPCRSIALISASLIP